mgnify:CR=1 FL=1
MLVIIGGEVRRRGREEDGGALDREELGSPGSCTPRRETGSSGRRRHAGVGRLGVVELVREQRSSGTRAHEAAGSSSCSRDLATRTPGLGSSAAGCGRRSLCSWLLHGDEEVGTGRMDRRRCTV